ncbi:hypothetical protein N665_0125s0027 [Sinapis alba]|nr:hypothetical protein N665_0125s0027 [Sinapis alba]
MSPVRHCSLKGKSVATTSHSVDSESSDSLLIRRLKALMLRGMENPRPPTGNDLAELNDDERSVVHFSMELENREASGHASPDEVEREAENIQATNSVEDADLVDKDKNPTEKETDFRLADSLPMRWTGTDFKFSKEIDPYKEHRFSARKNQKCVQKLISQTDPPAGFSFLIPASHQRSWTPLVGYACIAFGQYTANGIRIMVTLTVLAAELGIKTSVRLFEELTTPSITAETGFFYGKMFPKYNVITRNPSEVNFWNRSYFYVKINEASFEDPSVILNGYFSANIDRLGKWAQGGSNSFQVEAIRTLSHQHWPDISEARTPSHGQEGSYGGGRPAKRRRASHPDEGAPNVSPHPFPSPKVLTREHLGGEVGSQEPSPARNSALQTVDETEMEESQGGELQGLDPASPGAEVVEYPHTVDFCYQHTEVPFVGYHEASARLFSQIKLKKTGMPKLDELSQAVGRKMAEKTRSLKRKKKENAGLKGKCSVYEDQVGNLVAEKNEAVEMAEIEKYRGELLSKELEELKAQKEVLDSCLWRLEQEKIEADSKFEMTTKRLRESREHEVRKERLRVEAALRQHVMPVYEKGAREGLEKIQAMGMSMDKVLEQVSADENRYSDELNEMEVIEASEITLQPIGLDEHGSNLAVFSP